MTAARVRFSDYGRATCIRLPRPGTRQRDCALKVTSGSSRYPRSRPGGTARCGASRELVSKRACANSGLDQVVRDVGQEKPLLGICVGKCRCCSRGSEENGGVRLPRLFWQGKAFSAMSLYDGECAESAAIWLESGKASAHRHPMWHRIDRTPRFYFVQQLSWPALASTLTWPVAGHTVSTSLPRDSRQYNSPPVSTRKKAIPMACS